MTLSILLAGFLAVLATVSAADTETDIARCAAVEGSAARLDCYDALANKLGIANPEIKSATGSGKWRVTEETSKIDDSTNVYLRLASEQPIQAGYDQSHPSLHIRCGEDKTEVFINIGTYLGLKRTDVLTRFDREKARTISWLISTDSKAVFWPTDHIIFTKWLLEHNTLLVQLTPYGESPVTMEFDLRGLPQAIPPLQQACHWR